MEWAKFTALLAIKTAAAAARAVGDDDGDDAWVGGGQQNPIWPPVLTTSL